MNTSPSDHIPQEAFDWYDEYAHGLMDRRTFMKKLGGLAALGFSMAVLTSALLPNYALAEQVSFNDDDITATYEEFDSPNGHSKGKGYLATPKNIEGKLPVVLVIHENRGLNPYVKDVARRLAKVGFIAFAIMCVIMIVDLITGWLGRDLMINEFVYDSFVLVVLGCFGISGIEKFAKK